MELICIRPMCSFRVHDRYFRDKARFTPGICPVDGGPLRIVTDHTDQAILNKKIEIDPSSDNYRLVVDGAVAS